MIDKDLASSLLARRLRAELLLISTAVDPQWRSTGAGRPSGSSTATLAEARRCLAEGTHFQREARWRPKIRAVVEYLEAGPRGRAIITNPAHVGLALAGKAGTHVVP